jgi:hypothetical protein
MFRFSLLHNNSGFNPIRDDKSFASKFNGMNSISTEFKGSGVYIGICFNQCSLNISDTGKETFSQFFYLY